MEKSRDPLQRFSDRVDDYVKYRPSYPNEVLPLIGLSSAHRVADIGSGTGIFSRLLLENGNEVYGVEPNREMRDAGEEYLRSFPRFHSINGTAERTSLEEASVDFVTAAQAFHWFDLEKCKLEFRRILVPNGKVALIWNARQASGSPFLEAYDQLVSTYGSDYEQVNHSRVKNEAALGQFFARFERAECSNVQVMDFKALRGRLLSASYAPKAGPKHAAMLQELRRIFDRFQENGVIRFDYTTECFSGRPAK